MFMFILINEMHVQLPFNDEISNTTTNTSHTQNAFKVFSSSFFFTYLAFVPVEEVSRSCARNFAFSYIGKS